MCFSTTKSSARLDKAGISEIGLKCLLMLETGFFLGIGVMSACFHARGSFCSLYDVLSWCVIGSVRTSAYSLRIQLLMLPGPGALDGLRFFNFFRHRVSVSQVGVKIWVLVDFIEKENV